MHSTILWSIKLKHAHSTAQHGLTAHQQLQRKCAIIIIIINKVLIKVTLNKVIAGALYIVICG